MTHSSAGLDSAAAMDLAMRSAPALARRTHATPRPPGTPRVRTLSRGALIIACMLSACISEEPEPTGPVDGDVTIDMTSQLTFAPAAAQARVGQTVVWVNASSMPHTVTADPSLAANPASVSLPQGAEPFASPLVAAGGSYSRTFTVAGTYRYFCQPHEAAGMIGTIVVAP